MQRNSQFRERSEVPEICCTLVEHPLQSQVSGNKRQKKIYLDESKIKCDKQASSSCNSNAVQPSLCSESASPSVEITLYLQTLNSRKALRSVNFPYSNLAACLLPRDSVTFPNNAANQMRTGCAGANDITLSQSWRRAEISPASWHCDWFIQLNGAARWLEDIFRSVYKGSALKPLISVSWRRSVTRVSVWPVWALCARCVQSVASSGELQCVEIRTFSILLVFSSLE